MTTPLRYFAYLTHLGAQKLAQAAALGRPLDITEMAVGDGNGQLPTPDPAQTALVNERRRGALNTLTTDKHHPDQLIAEQVIPETEGGFWIRELGLYDKDGSLIAVGNCPETYKPVLQEGSGRTQTLRMVLVVSHAGAVTLKVDPSTVLATREYVDDLTETRDKQLQQQLKQYIQHRDKSDAVTSDSHATVATSRAVKTVHDRAEQKYTARDATTAQKGIVRLNSAVDSDDETTASTPKALKQVYELAQKQYVPLDATTARKGVTQLSSATDSSDETKAATPKAVRAAMLEAQSRQPKGDYLRKGDSYLKAEANTRFQPKGDYAPAGNYAGKGDSHSKAEALSLFLQKNQHGTDIPDKNAFIKNLGLSETVKQAQNAVPVTRTINGHSLKQNLTLTAGDIGTYTKSESDTRTAAAKKAGTDAQTAASHANNNANGRVPNSRKVNSKPLTSDITLSAGDIGTYTRAEIDKKITQSGRKNTAGKAVNGWWKCGDTGLIIQWGITPALNAGQIYTVPLPVAVPDTILTAFASVKQKGIAPEGNVGVYVEISGKTLVISADYTQCHWHLPRTWLVICR